MLYVSIFYKFDKHHEPPACYARLRPQNSMPHAVKWKKALWIKYFRISSQRLENFTLISFRRTI